jgi:hypothetical protein
MIVCPRMHPRSGYPAVARVPVYEPLSKFEVIFETVLEHESRQYMTLGLLDGKCRDKKISCQCPFRIETRLWILDWRHWPEPRSMGRAVAMVTTSTSISPHTCLHTISGYSLGAGIQKHSAVAWILRFDVAQWFSAWPNGFLRGPMVFLRGTRVFCVVQWFSASLFSKLELTNDAQQGLKS